MFLERSLAIDDTIGATVGTREKPAESTANCSAGDSAFIDRLRSEEPEAFNELVEKYSRDVYAMLARLTGDGEDARDLTQETFLKALKAVKSFRGDSGLKTWLFRIAINESRNRWRRWKRRRRGDTFSLENETGTDDDARPQQIADANAVDPEAAAISRERADALRKALSELPRQYREALTLRDIDGLSYEEVAQALGTNTGTVKSRIARGREELRRKLKGI